MSERKLIAALACRVGGGRLYGKPLQMLDVDGGITILDYIILGLQKSGIIDQIVLGIAEGEDNRTFIDVAKKHGISYIIGSEKDVLLRLVDCGRKENATDVYRLTPECPFPSWELLRTAWDAHIENGNDITVTDYMAEGMNFEIYTQESLERSHKNGGDYERSEYCSAYARRNPGQFNIQVIAPEPESQRTDLRVTVDWPEDLYVCRKIYEALKAKAPHIPIADIITYLDKNPHLTELISPYIDTTPIWASVLEKKTA